MFLTKNDFLQTLKDTNELNDIVSYCEQEIDKIDYLLYGKIRSSLDYDIIGYDGEETVRMLKGRSFTPEEVIRDNRDRLLEKKEHLEQKKTAAEIKLKESGDILNSMDDKLKSLITDIYLNKKHYREVYRRYGFFYEMEANRYVHRELNKLFKKRA